MQEKDPAAVELGQRGGLKGGPARASKLTAEQRSEISRKAARTRWDKEKDVELPNDEEAWQRFESALETIINTKMKRCSRCKELKVLERDFHRLTRSQDGRQPWCKECLKDHQNKRRPLTRPERERRDRAAWVEDRGGRCEFCGREENLAVLQLDKSKYHAQPFHALGAKKLVAWLSTARLACLRCVHKFHKGDPIFDDFKTKEALRKEKLSRRDARNKAELERIKMFAAALEPRQGE